MSDELYPQGDDAFYPEGLIRRAAEAQGVPFEVARDLLEREMTLSMTAMDWSVIRGLLLSVLVSLSEGSPPHMQAVVSKFMMLMELESLRYLGDPPT